MNEEKALVEVKTQITSFQNSVNALEIRHPNDVIVACDMLKTIKSVEDRLVERKEEITRPLMKALGSARDLFKPLEIGLAESKKTLKAKMLAFQAEEDLRIEHAQKKIGARVEKGTMKASTAVEKIEEMQSSRSSTKTRTLRKLSITDETLLPREYLVPDREAITRALFKDLHVPGATLIEEKIVVA